MCGAVSWTLGKVYQIHIVIFEMWCWGRTEKICWTDHVRNEVLHRAKKERSILHKQKRKAKWIGHNLRKELPSTISY